MAEPRALKSGNSPTCSLMEWSDVVSLALQLPPFSFLCWGWNIRVFCCLSLGGGASRIATCYIFRVLLRIQFATSTDHLNCPISLQLTMDSIRELGEKKNLLAMRVEW